jgi:predicted ATPase
MNSAFAEAFAKRGKLDKAALLLERSANFLNQNQQRYVEAEIERIRGELAVRRSQLGSTDMAGGYDDAERAFCRAMEIADRTGANSLRLRAAISLSRLQILRGKKGEAERILRQSYDCFTEGFDAPDLVEARTILDEMR